MDAGVQPAVPAESAAALHPDIFLIVLESTRGDYINKEVTPNLEQLRSECLPFPDTLAAGNASHISWYSLLTARHGLFFGAEKRATAHQGSFPIRLLRRIGYHVNVLCSSTLDYHDINKIAFGSRLELCDSMFDAEKFGVPSPPERDLEVTKRVLQAMDGPAGNRLFLVFFQSTHHDYDWPANEPAPFTPYAQSWNYADFKISPERLKLIMNRYRNALHFQDRLVGDILSKLKRQGRYNDVVLAVTGDHGEEFLSTASCFMPAIFIALRRMFPSSCGSPLV